MKITIGGLSGTGTSTIGKMLAVKLSFPFHSGGDSFRKVAENLGLSIEEFDSKFQNADSPEYDFMIDKMQKDFAQMHESCIIESRLGWYNLPESIKIKLKCSDQVRFARTSKKDENRLNTLFEDFENTRIKTLEREENHKNRITKIYGIGDLNDDMHYDLVIDTTDLGREEVLDEILKFIVRV